MDALENLLAEDVHLLMGVCDPARLFLPLRVAYPDYFKGVEGVGLLAWQRRNEGRGWRRRVCAG